MFYIKKITLHGSGVKDASIDLDRIKYYLCYPSNTGKSYISECIDYMLGNDKIRIDLNIGYQWIELEIESDDGALINAKKT